MLEIIVGGLVYCLKMGFTVFAICYGLTYLANFAFKFLTEDLEKHE